MAAARQAMFEALVAAFEQAEMPYCVLAGYDGYPALIPSDIDFAIPRAWSARLPAILAGAARRMDGHLVQCIRHETAAAYFAIARQDGDRIVWLHPDSCDDFRRGGRLLLRTADIIARRQRHRRGFWVPAAADGFAYYLIKKIDKGALDDDQAGQLSRRFAEDPQGCTRALRRLLPPAEAAALETTICLAQWAPVRRRLAALASALRRQAAPEPLGARLAQAAADQRRILDRLLRPTGLCLAFLGPDGSGKSSVIARVSAELAQAFRSVEYRHLAPPPGWRARAPRPGAAPLTADDPHGLAPRGRIGSFAKLLHFWATYCVGGLLWLYPRRVRSKLVIFDRYYHDILADPLRYRYAQTPALARLARVAGHAVPQPDLIFLLDAAPEILQARKQEVPLAEAVRQRAAYLRIAGEFAGARVVDAGEPLDKVVASVLVHVIEALEVRTHRRLGLDRDINDEEGAIPWKA